MENFIVVLKYKNYLEKRLLRILLHILSTSLELPRRARLALDHRGRQSVLLSFAFFFPLGPRGKEIAKPKSTFGKFVSISLIFVLEITLRVLQKL